jgi:hypothetical protein
MMIHGCKPRPIARRHFSSTTAQEVKPEELNLFPEEAIAPDLANSGDLEKAQQMRRMRGRGRPKLYDGGMTS